jgi:hypothetical protein
MKKSAPWQGAQPDRVRRSRQAQHLDHIGASGPIAKKFGKRRFEPRRTSERALPGCCSAVAGRKWPFKRRRALERSCQLRTTPAQHRRDVFPIVEPG